VNSVEKAVIPNFVVILALCGSVSIAVESTAPSDKINFNRDIRPILSGKCFACHGPDAKHAEGDLRLDLRDSATKPDGAIVPGKPAASELVRRIHSKDVDEQMPPKQSHKSLSASEKDLLARWIAAGAEYKPHWAFVSPVSPGSSSSLFLACGRRRRLEIGIIACTKGGNSGFGWRPGFVGSRPMPPRNGLIDLSRFEASTTGNNRE
jgi:hypothetical protein